ncbi:MAG: hypothetical protein KKA65_04835 [Nanoarchaeota archaeon]|nr:hypothetical protein [Nanoarchaeota archaeon]MBU4242616.1 hypothetical protein [Nanoarchaeota archaeon]MBU4351658.1 hypothetical protein [Nanoarchaeota archaeon]MBU4456802.1 hypothetical protein [Nanoarchaeota archaeon]MCG2719811.1 DUF5654 family protein [Nanoarchaeota archaeon]
MVKGEDLIIGDATGIKVSHIIKTSIVTAFTIAAAFIWKDVILEFIQAILPTANELLYKFIAATLATIVVIILIYIFLETESEVEFLIAKMHKNKNKPKKIKGVKILKV